MGGLEGAGGVAGAGVVGCPGVGGVGSCAADVAGDGGRSNDCGLVSVLASVQRGSFVYFAVDGADVEPAAVEAWDWEASWLIGVAAAHGVPLRGCCRCLVAGQVR